MLSVVIPTKNEAANIAASLRSFDGYDVEKIVVDNNSTDATREIAASLGAKVFIQGPERCAQRNRGWREATGDWVLFLDADMTLQPETVAEILGRAATLPLVHTSSLMLHTSPQAYYIPEVRDGRGLRAQARNFERSFYDATVIDGLRLIRRDLLVASGGYDENLVACEDWDLDRRILATGIAVASIKGHLVHHEGLVPLRRLLQKKAYYSTSVDRYRAKWHNDAIIRKQFGLYYRFCGVFVEHGKWRKIVRHPLLFACVLLERFLVGLTYLLHRHG